LLLAAPAVPLLFMGEEYGETAPFQFFTSFLDRDLAEAVRKGRTAEFSRFGWEGPVPDPSDPATFVRSRLNHSLAGAPRHRELYQYYRSWLVLRRAHGALGARGKQRARAELDAAGAVLTLSRDAASGPGIRLIANLTGEARPFTPPAGSRVLLDSEDVRFAGRGRPALTPHHAILYEVPA
jgi:maltooligosyltrehalose trehalohydrolase